MTDTELILSKIDELRTELKGDIQNASEQAKADNQSLREELKGDIAVLDTKIEAVQLGIVQLNDKLEFIEYGLQKEIETALCIKKFPCVSVLKMKNDELHF